MLLKSFTLSVVACSLALWSIGSTLAVAGECAWSKSKATAASHHESIPDIVDTAVSAESFSTLVTAVKAADLVETLKGEGPFTVFAPTNEAFAKVPEDQLNALLANKEALTGVLTYHVVAGKVMAADVVKLSEAATVYGDSIHIRVADGKVTVNGVNVIKTDIECSNGVIHVLDGVLLPPQ